MSVYFSIDEIFEIAEQIERNGAWFYRFAAKSIHAHPHQQALLNMLSDMEERHEKTFADMRNNILKQGDFDTIMDPDFDPEGQAALYLRVIADGSVFAVNADPADFLTGTESVANILTMALDREKNSIVFYTGMKEMVAKNLGREEIENIIKEEMTHITYVSNELAKEMKAEE